MSLTKQLLDYIHAAFSGIWIQTTEPDEAQREIAQLAKDQNWSMASWDCARGFQSGDGKGDPLAPLKPTAQTVDSDDTHLVVLHNYHRFLQAPIVMQSLFNAIAEGKQTRTFNIVLSPVVQIPIELQKLFVVIEHDLPEFATLNHIALDLLEGPDKVINGYVDAVRAAAGLTRYEAEAAFALSIARAGKINPDTVWEIKTQALKKSGLLTLHRGTDSFSNLGGLDALKSFCKQALATSVQQVRPKGVLLFGVPGTGKSAFAKALGNETKRPTLILDVGGLMGSLVGETEANIRQGLKVADAMSPCILFIDEIEKALAGSTSSHQGDSGVSSRLLGTLLTWMNDHTTDVFVVCTSNDINMLPPEFSRAERFDGIFFIDLPNQTERGMIWSLYENYYFNAQCTNDALPDDSQWTGAEVRSCCRLSKLLGCDLKTAATYIVPIASTAGTKVSALRQWASGKCLDASKGGIYQNIPQTTNTKRRAITAK